nr:hypothetical protein [Tanacetum cinerariifolium]
VKENQEKDKIGSKPGKNGKRGEAGKSQKQLQLKEEEKPKKRKGPRMQFLQTTSPGGKTTKSLILVVKENQEKDKIGSKPDKTGS